MRVLEMLPAMKMNAMLIVWENALKILSDASRAEKHMEARLVLDAISNEWSKRSEGKRDPDGYFKWPSTEADWGRGELATDAWLKEGLLQLLGYRVGTTKGEAQRYRELTLTEIFGCVVPPVFEPRYLAEWGPPASAARLKKMADSISAFTRNAKRRRDGQLAAAIRDWETDLTFLYFEFYIGKFHFAWPATTLQPSARKA